MMLTLRILLGISKFRPSPIESLLHLNGRRCADASSLGMGSAAVGNRKPGAAALAGALDFWPSKTMLFTSQRRWSSVSSNLEARRCQAATC